jgi:hypothetical protein
MRWSWHWLSRTAPSALVTSVICRLLVLMRGITWSGCNADFAPFRRTFCAVLVGKTGPEAGQAVVSASLVENVRLAMSAR